MSSIPPKGYVIKWGQETLWFLFLAVGIFVFTTVGDLESVEDWKTWAISVGGGLARVVGAVVTNQFIKLTGV